MKTKRYFKILLFCLVVLSIKKGIAGTPDWQWAKKPGTPGSNCNSITKDKHGNIYSIGSFIGTTDFDPDSGSYTLTPDSVNHSAAFISKMGPSGNFIWAKKIDADNYVSRKEITSDSKGNIYIAGDFSNTARFETDTGIYYLSQGSKSFIAKLDDNGSYIWIKGIERNADWNIASIAVDSSGSIYYSGFFRGIIDFDLDTILTYNLVGGPIISPDADDGFITKLDSNGNFKWAKILGGNRDDAIYSMCLDLRGNIYVSGSFEGVVDFDLDSFQTHLLTGIDDDYNSFISKYDSQGNFKWAKVNAGGYSISLGIANDYEGNVIATAFGLTQGNSVMKYDSLGILIWEKDIGDDSNVASSVTTNRFGNIFIIGQFSVHYGYGNPDLASSGDNDIFVLAINKFGNIKWTKGLGGVSRETPVAIINDVVGNIVLTGMFYSPILTFDNSTITIAGSGGNNSFIAKINCSTSSSISRKACNNYISPSRNKTWTSSGTYTDTIQNSAGCDSVITINLTINTLSSSSSQTITACNNYISPSGIYNWTSSGIYIDTIPNSAACDSIITFNLNINNSSSSFQTVAACHNYISPSGNFIWSASGTYLDTIPNLAGCDSIITTQLSINDNESTINQTGCDSIIVNAQKYTLSGAYTQVLTNSAGCDSILNLNLTIINSNDSMLTQTACDSLVVNGQKYISSGIYFQTLTNAFGCDSTLTLNLTINNGSESTLNETACSVYTLNGTTYNSSGVYSQTLSTTSGCDSIITLNLTINNTSNTISQTVCDSIIINGQKYDSSGVYEQTLTNAAGCDSLLTLNLTVNQGSVLTSTTSACHSYFTNGTTFTQSGLYHLPFINVFGCASVFNLNLTITHADTSVTQISNLLSANATSASYQWIDCNNGNLAIAGATANSYTATANGAFAVIVTQSLCTDTSTCYSVIGMGINENETNSIIGIFPNPAKDEFSISSIFSIKQIEIYNLLGEKIYTKESNQKQETIHTDSFPAGLYMLQIKTSDFIETRKLEVEK